jgi:hypothetical protein
MTQRATSTPPKPPQKYLKMASLPAQSKRRTPKRALRGHLRGRGRIRERKR